MKTQECIIRLIKDSEAPFLKEMLYEALFVPPGESPFPRGILDTPELKIEYENWGHKGDIGVVIEHERHGLIGASWVRLHSASQPGYGYVSDDIPELSIALKPDFRGTGLGSQLMIRLIDEVRRQGYVGISLSVDKRNQAMELYLRLGFEIVKSEGNPTMLLKFT